VPFANENQAERDVFSELLGETIKLTYQENEHVKTITGRLVEVSQEHVLIETESGTHSIGISNIESIETAK